MLRRIDKRSFGLCLALWKVWHDRGPLFELVKIVMTALSRLYLGYHWFTDAGVSLSLALMILGGIIALDTWWTARNPGEPITAGLSTGNSKKD